MKSIPLQTKQPNGNNRVLSRSAVFELAFLVLVAIGIYLMSVSYDAFETLVRFVHTHEAWELDEILMIPIIAAAGGLVFGYRRIVELARANDERRSAEKAARTMAMTDPLTGLPNRRGFESKVNAHFRSTDASHVRPMVVAIDLDRFKPINDLHGHAVGDAVLVEISRRLAGLSGPDGFAARLGGDEFVVFLAAAAAERPAARTLQHIIATLNRTMHINGTVCNVGASVGAAFWDEDGADVPTLMHRADIALYQAKRVRRGGYALFEQSMEDATVARAELEFDLRAAIANGCIVPYYHALSDLNSGAIVGYEVLARWNDERRGIVAPEVFIPLAEEAGIITDLMSSVVKKACLEAKAWPNDITISINISPIQFQDAWLAERLLKILVETGFPPQRLEVELTEHALIHDMELARKMVRSMKQQGVRVVLDDFGAGYGSLHHLSELPFDRLKIDRSFVHSYREDPGSRSIVSAILGLARSLDISVTAEGIEDVESEQILRDLGCDVGQGFLYGKPSRRPALPPATDAEEEPSTDTITDEQPRGTGTGGT